VSNPLPVYPFDPERCIGTVAEVSPSSAKVNLPSAAAPSGRAHFGTLIGGGEVGEFVVIECGETGVLGRLVNVKLPERERLAVEPELGGVREAHPIGTIQLLTTISLSDGRVAGGIAQHPRLGSKAYTAHPDLIKWIAESTGRTSGEIPEKRLRVASLDSSGSTWVELSPEILFGRHCAVLGATGGGKSWTVARLVEQAAALGGKLLLIDATGEFHTLKRDAVHFHIGEIPDEAAGTIEVVFPCRELTEDDLFALFRPSGQVQVPKLRDAMKSLKLAALEPALSTGGIVVKANNPRKQFDEAYRKHAASVEGNSAAFDIAMLPRQVEAECVWSSGGTASSRDYSRWGRENEQELSYCVTLVGRIGDMIRSRELACVFQPGAKLTVQDAVESFLTSPSDRVLRLSLKHVPFTRNAREIIANAIGRHLLARARSGSFKTKPVVVFLDEAHQFLDKTLGDENNRYPLDSFELIAKEGRKFSLTICIATQRPRDIPEGVLSQMGTLVVHRLINDRDREVVERASGDIDKSAAAFLPTLAPGQAALIGVDFPMPLTVQIEKPLDPPDSRGPDYQKHWNRLDGDGAAPSGKRL
jgi:hypothetical protein